MQPQMLTLDQLLYKSWLSYRPQMRFLAALTFVTTALFAACAATCYFVIRHFFGAEITATWHWIVTAITRGYMLIKLPPFPRHAAAVSAWSIGTGLFLLAALSTCFTNALWHAVLNGSCSSTLSCLRAGFRGAPRLFIAMATKYIVILFSAVFFFIPAILVAGWYIFVEICAAQGDGPLASLRTSAGLVIDRWNKLVVPFVFGYLLLAALPILLVGILESALFAMQFNTHQTILNTGLSVRHLMEFFGAALIGLFALPWYHVYKKILFEEAQQTVIPLLAPVSAAPQPQHSPSMLPPVLSQ